MPPRSTRPALALSLATILSLTSGLHAANVRFDGVTPSQNVSISTDAGAHFRSYKAGLNHFTGSQSNSNAAIRGAFTGFCIDFSQSISTGHSYSNYTLVPLDQAGTPAMGASAAGMISELWGRHFETLQTSTQYAAFQCAIWELLYDSDISLTQGSFRMSNSSVRSLTQTWLGELNGSPAYHAANLYAIKSPTNQDMIIPTPGTAALLAGGFGLAIRRRRR